jgi:hypothetical protein
MMKRENQRKSGQSGSAKRLACSLWEMGSQKFFIALINPDDV